MAFSQAAFSLKDGKMLEGAALESEEELEIALEKHIDMLDANWLVIGRQVETRNGKRLDLLCMDRACKLIVVELKKDRTPREVTAQVIEYASYMQEQQADDIAGIYAAYRKKYVRDDGGSLDEAYREKFGIQLTDLEEALSSQHVQMVIVAAQMDDGTEHIIRYLRTAYDMDINILFFKVFGHGEDRFLSRVWFEEGQDVQKPIDKEKWNGEYYVSFGGDSREWADAARYGFVSAGGSWHTKTLKLLHEGDRIWVKSASGYVGAGIVKGGCMRAGEAVLTVEGKAQPFSGLALKGRYFEKSGEDEEYIVPVSFLKTVPEQQAVRESGFFGNENTVCRPRTSQWRFTVERLKKIWQIP